MNLRVRLVNASVRGDLGRVRLLLALGADANSVVGGRSALSGAFACGAGGVVDALVEAGADVGAARGLVLREVVGLLEGGGVRGEGLGLLRVLLGVRVGGEWLLGEGVLRDLLLRLLGGGSRGGRGEVVVGVLGLLEEVGRVPGDVLHLALRSGSVVGVRWCLERGFSPLQEFGGLTGFEVLVRELGGSSVERSECLRLLLGAERLLGAGDARRFLGCVLEFGGSGELGVALEHFGGRGELFGSGAFRELLGGRVGYPVLSLELVGWCRFLLGLGADVSVSLGRGLSVLDFVVVSLVGVRSRELQLEALGLLREVVLAGGKSSLRGGVRDLGLSGFPVLAVGHLVVGAGSELRGEDAGVVLGVLEVLRDAGFGVDDVPGDSGGVLRELVQRWGHVSPVVELVGCFVRVGASVNAVGADGLTALGVARAGRGRLRGWADALVACGARRLRARRTCG